MRENVSLKTYLITSIFVAILCIAITSYVYSSGSEITIEKDSFIKSASYIIENDTSTIKAFDGQTGEMVKSGSELASVWNWVRDNGLTNGRTWKEKVLFKGVFEIDYNADEIEIGNYTILDFAGSFLKVKDGADYDDDYGILRGKSVPANDIEIRNVIFDENAVGAPTGWANIIWFTRGSNIKIVNCDLRSPIMEYDPMWFEGSPYGSNVQVIGNTFDSGDIYFYTDYLFASQNKVHDCNFRVFGEYSMFTENILTGTTTIMMEGEYSVATSNNINGTGGIGAYERFCTISSNILNQTSPSLGTIYISADDCVVIGNALYGTIGTGWQSFAIDVGSDGENLLIANNIVDTFDVGITLDTGTKSLVFSNVVSNCDKGIHAFQATNSTIKNNVLDNNTKGIYFRSVDSKDHHVEGNTFLNNIENIDDEGSGSVYKRNVGFVTENSGTSSNSVNATWVTHGLAGTPDVVTLTINGSNYINSTCYLIAPTVIASNSTHFQIGFYIYNADTIGAVTATDQRDIMWTTEYKP